MSSVSVEANTGDSNFFSEHQRTGVISTNPKTEPKEIRAPSQYVRLKKENQRKSAPSSSTISSCPDVEQQLNGGLKVEGSNHLSTNPDSTDNASNQDAGNLLGGGIPKSPEVKETCRFFEKNGFCKYGRNCRYFHPLSNRTSTVKPKSSLTVRRPNQSDALANSQLCVSEETPGQSQIKSPPNRERICKFFSRRGFCLYGKWCRFVHQAPQPDTNAEEQKETVSETTLNENSEENGKSSSELDVEASADVQPETVRRSNRACRFYLRSGECRFGETCKFRHIEPKIANQIQDSVNDGPEKESSGPENLTTHLEVTYVTQTSVESQSSSSSGAPKPVVPLKNKKRSDMSLDDLLKLRKTEINQLKRKYPRCTETKEPDIGTVFEILFLPTDPDWRFDVKSITMNVMIPENYPDENLQVDILNSEGMLPEKLVRFFNKTTFNWLQEQHEKNQINDEVQLIFRPFTKWLDKNLEDIFIGGLKMVKREMEAEAAGIQFVTHEELNSKNNNQQKKKLDAPEEPDIPVEEPEYYDDSAPHCMEDVSSESVLLDTVVDWRCASETAKRGTEIKLRNLELLDAAASLTCCKLSVTVQCGRCKMRSDIAAHPHRGHKIDCERCKHKQKLTFRPQMLHQFSNVLGYLDLESCQVVDIPLLTCEFALQCLPCGRQNFVSGIQYGQCHNTWCLFCHSKMSVRVESIKMNQLMQASVEPIESKTGQPLKLEKKEKRVKDPAIQEGKPLPENGTCKHYKKSFRWLRFPCCGKAYPCDSCHFEKESDHEMKLATRMICGFCAKEQPYSKDRPCTSCLSNMAKKSGTHWEGGKGCRDKVKMSRDDKQKYSGSNKTLSRKSQPAPKKEK